MLPLDEIKSAADNPQGYLALSFYCKGFTDVNTKVGVLFSVANSHNIMVLDRTDNLILKYYYKPINGQTLVAKLNLNIVPNCNFPSLVIFWAKTEASFYFLPKDNLVNAQNAYKCLAVPSNYNMTSNSFGDIILIGEKNHYEIEKENNSLSSAFQSWKQTIKAIELLELTDEIREHPKLAKVSIICNLAMVTIVTGFESYFRYRFLELEKKGLKSNFENLFKCFASNSENISDHLKEAKKANLSPTQLFIKKQRINFQNFDNLKKAYNKAYGMTLNKAKISSELISPIREYIQLRHSIIHGSAISNVLGFDKESGGITVITPIILKEIISNFDALITKFHNYSLKVINPSKQY